MATPPFRTTPVNTDRMPPGILYIVLNEAAERFNYYGLNSVLVVFMTRYLLDPAGHAAPMTEAHANAWYHIFVSCVYFLPILGAFLADAVLGKYRTVLYLSLTYCLGNFALAADHTRLGLVAGLGLIALGSGGIKPCVSANVGDQFGAANQHLLARVFSWFYFAINFGSAFSTLLIPWLLDRSGPRLAFAVPGVFMILATLVFWLGRRQFVHVPPVGVATYVRALGKSENLRALGNLLILVPFAAVFWGLWQQNFSSWVLQAYHLNRHLFGVDWLPAQIQTVNPLFILVMLPLFSYAVYPALNRVFPLSPLRKIGLGLFCMVGAFAIVAWIQTRIDAGGHPTVLWQILAFLVLTAAEILVSVTHLEFAYTQAPREMKSLVMCTYLGAVALGNVFTAAVDFFIQNPDGTVKLAGASYFWFFAAVMAATAVVFVFAAGFYKGRTYTQDAAAAA
ncbi:MAG TPA: POT family MFS transporter [Opitutaceae bacterium]|nr:POT family MFS transporter [Opitutaceae bacterium]